MTALFTALCTKWRGRGGLADVAVTIAIVVLVWRDATRASGPDIALAPNKQIFAPVAQSVFEPTPPTDPNVAAITEVHRGPPCGKIVGATEVRYGDHFTAIVPCAELAAGLPFAVGDVHKLMVDDDGQIRAITWHGRTWRFDGAYEAVQAPAAAFGKIASVFDNRGHYSAPNWSWH
jgi:hypothetical protein